MKFRSTYVCCEMLSYWNCKIDWVWSFVAN